MARDGGEIGGTNSDIDWQIRATHALFAVRQAGMMHVKRGARRDKVFLAAADPLNNRQ
jgi:hypothetical protein